MLIRKIEKVLGLHGHGLAASPVAMSGDGSLRRFYRGRLADGRSVVLVLPADTGDAGLAEARSAFLIGRHLSRCGVPVPAIYLYDPETGLLVFADAGDTHLADWIEKRKNQPAAISAMYRRLLGCLVQMQVDGRRHFQARYCHDTPRYDHQVMLERESGYFLDAFVGDYLGITPATAIRQEFQHLADLCAAIPADFFLHRDFQSRNILVRSDWLPCIIDFQAGRFGPLGYDLASLLRDPYVCLAEEFQTALLDHYLDLLQERITVDRRQFLADYHLLALQRNLQILGAFAFLSRRRGKKWFARYIGPAFNLLETLVRDRLAGTFTNLYSLIRKIRNETAALFTGGPGGPSQCR